MSKEPFSPQHPAYQYIPKDSFWFDAIAEDDLDFVCPPPHPEGARLMQDPVFHDCTYEFAPFGSDDGHDAFFMHIAMYQEPGYSIETALAEMIESTGYNWDKNDYLINGHLIKRNSWLHPLDIEQIIIGKLFAQVYLEGKLDPQLKPLLIKAIQNIDTMGYTHNPEMKNCYEKMLSVANLL